MAGLAMGEDMAAKAAGGLCTWLVILPNSSQASCDPGRFFSSWSKMHLHTGARLHLFVAGFGTRENAAVEVAGAGSQHLLPLILAQRHELPACSTATTLLHQARPQLQTVRSWDGFCQEDESMATCRQSPMRMQGQGIWSAWLEDASATDPPWGFEAFDDSSPRDDGSQNWKAHPSWTCQ